MRVYNCIIVFDKDKNNILFCKRVKPPYQGLYNLVGGKVEIGECGEESAYRELYEETGITQDNIELFHYMDIMYYKEMKKLEIYGGILNQDVTLKEEFQELYWVSTEENFFDMERFAGEGNIGHMIRQLMY